MDLFKENYPEELKQFYQDERYKQEVASLVKRRDMLKKKVKQQDEARQATREEIKLVFSKTQELSSKRDLLGHELLEQTKAELADVT